MKIQKAISIDALTFTADLYYKNTETQRRVKELAMKYLGHVYVTGSKHYHYNCLVEETLFFQFVHQTAEKQRCRIEFNPNRLKDNPTKKQIVLDFLSLMYKATITRKDIAIDIFDVDILNEYKIYDKISRSQTMWLSRSKRLETLYLGRRQSDEMIRIYDKNVQQKNKMEIDELGIVKDKWFRVEAELKDERAKLDFYNPFTNFYFYRNSNVDSDNWKEVAIIEFLIKDLDNNIKFLNKNSRSKYLKKCEEYFNYYEEIDLAEYFVENSFKLYEIIDEYLTFVNDVTKKIDIIFSDYPSERYNEINPRETITNDGDIFD